MLGIQHNLQSYLVLLGFINFGGAVLVASNNSAGFLIAAFSFAVDAYLISLQMYSYKAKNQYDYFEVSRSVAFVDLLKNVLGMAVSIFFFVRRGKAIHLKGKNKNFDLGKLKMLVAGEQQQRSKMLNN